MGHLLSYARVSTTDQQPQLQVDALELAGCYRVFTETASGAAADRPTLEQLLDQLRPGDTLVVWKLDRLGRSLRHLVDTVTGLADRGIGSDGYGPRFLANLWQTAVLSAPGMQEAGYGTRPGLVVWGGAPRRNRTGDPILTIDARVVHNALQHLAWPHNRADERRRQGLGVVTGEVVDAADRWAAAEGGVGSVMVVPVDPGLQGAVAGGI
jgi:hypothetical protein